MNIEQERADFEEWAKGRGMTLHKASPCDGSPPYYLDTASIAAWEGYQAGRAALQPQEYTATIGGAGQAYLDKFKGAHALPTEFRWSELWAVMSVAANRHRSEALQSQEPRDDDSLAIAYMSGYHDGKRSTIPEGWQLVPVEPTDDMALAASRVGWRNPAINGVAQYKAMLEAAPKFGEEE